MPADPDHWLWRLDADAWLASARNELELARSTTGSRRTAITHARRAAGMALNGVLVRHAGDRRGEAETRWGRSYMDHLRALARAHETDDAALGAPLPREAWVAARDLITIPVMPPSDLLRIGRSRDDAARRATALGSILVDACASD